MRTGNFNCRQTGILIVADHLAKILGVSRKTASKIVNERGSITPGMALRLSRAFNTTPNLWLGLQQEYDLWHAIHDSKEWLKVKSVNQFAGITA